METPNPKWHLRLSLVKSVFRIGAGVGLIQGNFNLAGILLIVAEGVGVLEELV